MQLIKRLESKRDKSGHIRHYGLFLCPICDKGVIRLIFNGEKQETCGIHKRVKHGGKGTRLYRIWNCIKDRCLNINNQAFKNYGGRGITICPEWTDKLNGFIKFRDWSLNNGYTEGLQIHRENDGNYEPYNCEWVTNTENARHRRGQKIKNIEMANEIRELEKIGNHTRKELAEKYGVSQMQISNIINNKKWV